MRDYGTASWDGGDPDCDHNPQRPDGGDRSDRTLPLGRGGLYRETCSQCGARRIDQQLGLEKTPDEYVAKMVEIFREVKRVLRDDGTLWLNLGDSYSGSGKAGNNPDYQKGHTEFGKPSTHQERFPPSGIVPSGLKPKDLIGIPWLIAFALRADGWYLRMDNIWNKPNPMPESVKDRPTKSHEYIFLLSKSQKYYYDYEAILEPVTGNAHPRGNGINPKAKIPAGWDTRDGNHREKIGRYPRPKQNESFSSAVTEPVDLRNRRSVWTVATQPFSAAHFATFPEKLIEPFILAGCPKGGTVLDPFIGSCTTAVVAKRLQRRFIGIDLKPEYLDMRKEQLSQEVLAL